MKKTTIYLLMFLSFLVFSTATVFLASNFEEIDLGEVEKIIQDRDNAYVEEVDVSNIGVDSYVLLHNNNVRVTKYGYVSSGDIIYIEYTIPSNSINNQSLHDELTTKYFNEELLKYNKVNKKKEIFLDIEQIKKVSK